MTQRQFIRLIIAGIIATSLWNISTGQVANRAPVFITEFDRLAVPKNAKPGSVVLQLVAVDKESEVYYGVEEPNGLLSVDEITGVVLLKKSLVDKDILFIEAVFLATDLAVDGPAVTTRQNARIKVMADTSVPVVKANGSATDKQLARGTAQLRFMPDRATVDISEKWPINLALPFDTAVTIKTISPNPGPVVLTVVGDNANLFEVSPKQIKIGGKFDLMAKTGDALDYEKYSPDGKIFLQIQADDEKGNNATLPVTVMLRDSNEFAPAFAENSIALNGIDKGIFLINTPDTKLAILNITDRDGGEFGIKSIVYTVYGQYAQMFRVSTEHTGTVALWVVSCRSEPCLADNIPSELNILLRATDANGRGSSTDALIDIKFADVAKTPDKVPIKFDRDHYVVKLEENGVEFSPFLQIKLEPKLKSMKEIHYQLIDPTALFGIENSTGVVFVRHPEFVTVENLGMRFNLTAKATLSNGQTGSSNIIVEIVHKVDHSSQLSHVELRFGEQTYNYSVDSWANKPTTVGMVTVTMAKEAKVDNVPISYAIAQGGAGYLMINETSGAISYTGPIIEDDRTYDIRVIAIDDGMPPRVAACEVSITVVGLKSSLPKFAGDKRVTVAIDEDLQIGSSVYKFSAVDGDIDSFLVFKIAEIYLIDRLGNQIENTSDQYFGFLSDTNGELKLEGSLKDANIMSAQITVTVMDSNHPTETVDTAYLIVNIRAEEKSAMPIEEMLRFPKTLPSVLSLAERLPVGAYVYTVAAERQPKGGLGSELPEIKYDLLDGREYFKIDQQTGVIRLRKQLLGVNSTFVTVRASHRLSGEFKSVKIDVKIEKPEDVYPMFDKTFYTGTISHTAPVGTVVAVIPASHPSMSDIEYSLEGPDADTFTVNNTGAISVSKELAKKDGQIQMLTVVARSVDGREAKVPVHLSVLKGNRYAPVFRHPSYQVTTVENAPIGSHILSVSARDNDGDKVRYSLMLDGGSSSDGRNLEGVVQIDSEQGVVTNIRPLIGYEGVYHFAALAFDVGGRNVSAPVHLTIQGTAQCQPTFQPEPEPIITVEENKPAGLLIADLHAAAPGFDCPVAYLLWNTTSRKYVSETNLFRLDSGTGRLTTNTVLDRENSASHGLVVAAQSDSLYTQRAIEVRVMDVNDNLPEFPSDLYRFHIPEGEAPHRALATLRAHDSDQGEFGRVYYHLTDGVQESMAGKDEWPSSDMFYIEIDTGVIRLKQSLDRERKDRYRFWVVATNTETLTQSALEQILSLNDSRQKTELIVTVVDINDNGPVFERSEYKAAVSAQASRGHLVAQVHAQDPDSDLHNAHNKALVLYRVDSVEFYIKSKAVDGFDLLTVDERSGEVRIGNLTPDYAHGCLVAKLASADLRNRSRAQSASTIVKVWIYTSDQLIKIMLNERPEGVSREKVEKVLQYIGTTVGSGANAILKNVVLAPSDGGEVNPNGVTVYCIVVKPTPSHNQSTVHKRSVKSDLDVGVILPAAEVLKAIDQKATETSAERKKLNIDKILPGASRSRSGAQMVGDGGFGVETAEVALILFACVLFFGLIGFILILCYYRYSFLRKRKELKNQQQKRNQQQRQQTSAVNTARTPLAAFTTPPATLRSTAWLPIEYYNGGGGSKSIIGVGAGGSPSAYPSFYAERPASALSAPVDTVMTEFSPAKFEQERRRGLDANGDSVAKRGSYGRAALMRLDPANESMRI